MDIGFKMYFIYHLYRVSLPLVLKAVALGKGLGVGWLCEKPTVYSTVYTLQDYEKNSKINTSKRIELTLYRQDAKKVIFVVARPLRPFLRLPILGVFHISSL